MRRVSLLGIAFVCTAALLSVSGVQAQRIPNGDVGSLGSSIAPGQGAGLPGAQADMGAGTPGFFPLIMRVAGTVGVSNFPPTQNVTGAVAVSNLPMDASGNLRVVGPPPAPTFSFSKIVNGLSVDGQDMTIGPFPTDGHQRFSLFVRANLMSSGFGYGRGNNGSSCISISVDTGGEDMFVAVPPANTLGSQCTSMSQGMVESVSAGVVYGPELRVHLSASGGATATTEVWLYLSN